MTCPFEGCSFKQSIVSTFTAYRSRYQRADFANFKPDLVVKCHSQAFINDERDLNNSVSSEFQPVHNSIPFTLPASSPFMCHSQQFKKLLIAYLILVNVQDK